jgi:hypothetical protein
MMAFDGYNYLRVDLKAIEGYLTDDNNATLKLKSLDLVNDGGGAGALHCKSSAASGSGIKIEGAGSDGAVEIFGGSSGDGVDIYSTANGLSFYSSGKDISAKEVDSLLRKTSSGGTAPSVTQIDSTLSANHRSGSWASDSLFMKVKADSLAKIILTRQPKLIGY